MGTGYGDPVDIGYGDWASRGSPSLPRGGESENALARAGVRGLPLKDRESGVEV
ncbi:Uncharacterised protein [Mycobacteroides abscessus subsp. abscessus]|nr:Uncharacterised protein [Mycobacteroides abscessus subsp. abscessus]